MKRTSISWYEYANQFGRGNLTQQRRVVRISRISTVRGRFWPTIFDVDYVDHGQLGGLHLRYNLPRIQRGRRGGELEKSTLLDAMTEAEHLEANSPVLSIHTVHTAHVATLSSAMLCVVSNAKRVFCCVFRTLPKMVSFRGPPAFTTEPHQPMRSMPFVAVVARWKTDRPEVVEDVKSTSL